MQLNNSNPEAPPKVGQEIQRLRLKHKLTLEQLAGKSGVSKSILSQIERDLSNPTLATIWRITNALESPLEDLLAGKDESTCFEKLSQNATPEVMSEDSRFRLKILGTLNTVSSVQWYEFSAEPNAELISEGHGTGSLESLTLCSGNLTVTVGTETQSVCTGETLRFRTDITHSLKNEGQVPAQGFMVNLL
ncbi:MAG: helix-turn-helix transcriptional regulator [SAR324 cluster bacterium]|nr:helix-turn-helix transcriptional regulator [SAR324 cluster bacterium]MBL7034871.1 helix-turn-helix transcriptional regulator [SAR324 cluster bacterium]